MNLIPLLQGALERVNRASKHFLDLKVEIEVIKQKQDDAVTWQFDPDHSDKFIVGISHHVAIPMVLGILVGEIVYNLRAALDYLVFDLARLDTGQSQEGTQFPIEDTKKGFTWRQKRGWLKGLNTAHVTAIETLQPYNGCDWTRSLRDISNPDKHRHIIGFYGDMALTAHAATPDRLTDLEDMPGTISSARHPITGQEVHVKLHLAMEVQFSDGTPVVETLEIIKLKVAETLEAFKPEFK